jgi:hypothetical protein
MISTLVCFDFSDALNFLFQILAVAPVSRF